MPAISEEAYQFKNLILSDKYLDEQSKLTAIIGIDDKEEPILFDFAKHPHLFIGGDQGCGKSTLIHSIIMSLMQRNTPEEFQFVYIDAKGLDVNLYNQSKYLHIGKNHRIVDIFEYLIHECDKRARLLCDNKKKTIASYNEFAALCDGVQTIPELFIILDEVSSFIDDVKHYIEQLITHGRTVGVHLIIADTNPTLSSVLKIAKLIPDKVVFRFTYADYKALLERNNVVPLSDDGEILCDFRGAEYVHGHACFVSEDEVKQEVAKNIVKFKEEEQVKKEKSEPKEEEFGADPLLCDAAILAIKQKGLRAADLQKALKVGYARASRIVDELEERGIVGYSRGAEPRECLVKSAEELKEALGDDFEIEENNFSETTDSEPEYEETVSKHELVDDETDYEEDKPSLFQRFTSRIFKFSKVILLSIFTLITILLIAGILNSTDSDLNIFTVIIVVIAFYAIISLVTKDKKKRSETGVKYNIYAIDRLADGHDFEYVVADLLRSVGFYNVRVTVGSGDYGIDVVGWYGESSYAIQCKKYLGKVGVSAVQEAFAGRSYYGCNYAMVITNNYFTPAAIKLARSTGVILWDRSNVIKLINGHI
ncbi:MAG: restriction endonuclease [Clostridia bacterium]|nr:restriction endonuclease [Clostridia bacterium]